MLIQVGLYGIFILLTLALITVAIKKKKGINKILTMIVLEVWILVFAILLAMSMLVEKVKIGGILFYVCAFIMLANIVMHIIQLKKIKGRS